ncbi:MAG: extracellular solute-binding protein [Limnochordia bacterium]|nr:extracellular solute-binding protein [Limnochordia bacterium]
MSTTFQRIIRCSWFVVVGIMVLCTSLIVRADSDTITLEVILNSWQQEIIDVIKAGISRFEEANPGINVEVRQRGTWDDVVVRIVSGVAPDILSVDAVRTAEMAQSGVLMELDDLIAQFQLEPKILPAMWDNAKMNGRTYSVPALESGPRAGMLWNKDMVNEAGLAVNPDEALTWPEFLDYADKLTRINADGSVERIGFDPRNGQNTSLNNIEPLWNAMWLNHDTHLPQLDSPEFVQGFELLTERVYQKYPAFGGSDGWYVISTQKVATTMLGSYAPRTIQTTNPGINLLTTWSPHVDGMKTQRLFSWGLAIPVGAEYPEISMRLIEFLATDVEFQLDLFSAVGWMGAGIDLYGVLPDYIDDPATMWYVRSLAEAEITTAHYPHPALGTAQRLFNAAKNKIFNLEEPADNALKEANRLLLAEMERDGLIP